MKLARQTIKEAARRKVKMETVIKKNTFGEKLIWIRDKLEPDTKVLTGEMVQKLMEEYLGRFDEELEQIQLKHSVGQRKGRQHASREDVIQMTISREKEEYETCGIEIVDILNPIQLEMLRKWDGNLGLVQNFKITRYSRKYLENYKPPKNSRSAKLLEEIEGKPTVDPDKSLQQEMQS
ncbi:hypothetical protein AAG570_002255 [Ranatra chinensis]|uniref:Translation machinery-associated protein 16 n=1 Tax=Ranatra chinensis TaxID=642074 RepID=A0ABD0Y703_9HEMI